VSLLFTLIGPSTHCIEEPFFLPLNNIDMASKALEKIICLNCSAVDYKRFYEKYQERNAADLIPDKFLEGLCNECFELKT
jgi:hypothetical protein